MRNFLLVLAVISLTACMCYKQEGACFKLSQMTSSSKGMTYVTSVSR